MGTCFNTQPPEGGWTPALPHWVPIRGFNTQPPEGGWALGRLSALSLNGFNTQPPEGGWLQLADFSFLLQSFNTQPPEGGWTNGSLTRSVRLWFQHTAARRRLANNDVASDIIIEVSTHSRPKAAGFDGNTIGFSNEVSTHSRPKAAGENSSKYQKI